MISEEQKKVIELVKNNNVVCDSDDGYIYEIKTSTTRNDIGDGACEILYVTDVSWLTK